MSNISQALATIRPGVSHAVLTGINVQEAQAKWPDAVIVDCGDCLVRFDDVPQGFVAPTEEDISAAVARIAKREAAAAAFAAAIAAGVTHAGKTFQIDDASQGRIGAEASRAAYAILGVPGIVWEPGTVFIAMNNEQVPFTAAEFLAMAQAASNRVRAIRLNYRDMKDAIDAAPDVAAVEAIDTGAGW